MRFPPWLHILSLLCFGFVLANASILSAAEEKEAKDIFVEALVAGSPAKQREIILSLSGYASPEVTTWINQWREGQIYLHHAENGVVTPLILEDSAPDGVRKARRFIDDRPFADEAGVPIEVDLSQVKMADTSSGLRRAMKEITDLAALNDPNPVIKLRAIQDAAIGQRQEKLPSLRLLLEKEEDTKAVRALEISIAMIQLGSPNAQEQIEACKKLEELTPLSAHDALKNLQRTAGEAGDAPLAAAATAAVKAIDAHISKVNAIGTAFRGLSLGSVLLVVAMGLAITFGLMGVINMAHGEFIAIGAYTTFVIQNIFAGGLRLSPFGKSFSVSGLELANGGDLYFLFALPASFMVAALIGILLERSVIQFLYKRPLESLLATWGISLVMQQMFRLIFGANNVPVSSPSWLSGNWTVNDVVFGWNRVFVIGFAILLILITWLVLNKTSLGLLIRAVMQNRNMAACMGVRTERVNTLTFAFGCGLAGLAGAFLSQIGNVGPSLGQNYIVDSFMTVVVGGVGNILGTVISALGIGLADQSLQQYLGNPVIGKILVLGAIILFLQWRPSGLFVTRSRSLD